MEEKGHSEMVRTPPPHEEQEEGSPRCFCALPDIAELVNSCPEPPSVPHTFITLVDGRRESNGNIKSFDVEN